MGRQVRHCGRVCAAALTVLVSAELRADVPRLTLDFAGKNASGVYVVSPGGMSFVGSLSATELNIGGLVPSDNGTAVGVLSPANTSLANRAYLGSNDVGVSNFRFHSSDFADRDNWDNPRDIYQGADDPLPIAIPGVPTFNDDLVFTPPGTPPLASTVRFANGSLNLGQLRMLAGSRDGAPAYDNTLSLAGIWTTAQSCTLNDDADPGQMLNRVGGTSRMTLDAQSGLIFSGDLVMGNTGTAVLTAAGGQVRAANVNVGNQTGAQGLLTITGAASLQVTGATRLGVVAGSEGTLTLDASGFQTNDLYVGNGGVGHLIVRNGSQIYAAGDVAFATSAGSSAPDSFIRDPNSRLQVSGNLTVGGAGSAALTVSDAAEVSVNGAVVVGAVAGAEATLTLAGSTTQISANSLSVGASGKGTLILQDGFQYRSNTFLTLGATPTGDGTLRVGDGTLCDLNGIAVGAGGTGRLELTGTGRLASSSVAVSTGATPGTGIVEMYDSSSWSVGSLSVGNTGDGRVVLHGSSKLDAGILTLGYQNRDPAGRGTLTIDGPGVSVTTTNGDMQVGTTGIGILEVTNGGTLNLGGIVALGGPKGSSGTLRVIGKSATGTPSTVSLKLLRLGSQGGGTLELDNGGELHVDTLSMGSFAGDTSTVTLTNGAFLAMGNSLGNPGTFENPTWRVQINSHSHMTSPDVEIHGSDTRVVIDSEMAVDAGGAPVASLATQSLNVSENGLLDVSGGGFVSTKGLGIGSPYGPSTVRVHGGSSIQNSGGLSLQYSGSLAVFDGGSVVSNATTPQAITFASTGIESVSGIGSKLDTGLGSLLVLNGALTVTQGASVETKDLFLNGALSVTDSGSLLRSSLASSIEHAQIFNGGALTVTGATADFQELLRVYRGGAVTVSGVAAVLGAHSGDSVTDMDVLTGSVTVNGGLLDAPDIVLHSTSKITSQLILDSADARMQGTSLRVGVNASGVVETGGSASAEIRNGATATITTTTVGGGGTVTVGTGSNLTGAVSVLSGGRLMGTGRVVGNVTNSAGTVAPGNSPGTLTVQGTYVQAALASMDLQIDGTSAGQYDQLIVTGSADLRGQVLLDFLDGYAPRAGDAFDILSFGSVTNYSPTYVVEGLAPGWQFSVAPHGGIYTLTSLSNAVATPEPQAPGIVLALAGYALHRRSRRCSASSASQR